MRTELEENQAEDLTLTQLQDELRDLAIRTRRLERQVHDIQHAGEQAVPPRTTTREPHGRITGSAETLQVGDHVRFRATKVTPGGIGRIAKLVPNFVILERLTGGPSGKVQRAPHNVQRLDDE